MYKKIFLGAIFFIALFSVLLVGPGAAKATVTASVTPLTEAMFIPQDTQNAVTNYSNPNLMGGTTAIIPFQINVTSTAGETLSSVAFTINNASTTTSTQATSSMFNDAEVYSGALGPGMSLAGSTSSANINIGATTTINITSPATTTTSTYTVWLRLLPAPTSTYWTDHGYPDATTTPPVQITVSIAPNGLIMSTSSPTISATTTQVFIADTHSQVPATSSISANYSGGVYSIFSTGGAEEQGVLNIYNSSSSTSTIATANVNASGVFSPVSIGSQYMSSVWVSGRDILSNPTSSLIQYNLPAAPTVTSIKAFADRIIINASANLNGQQAMNCNNYLINGSSPNCSGSNGAYVNFNGNQMTIMGLSLTPGTNISFSVSGIADNTQDQFPLTFSTSSLAVSSSLTPSISSISPSQGVVGASITITGSNFGSATGTVMFSGGMNQNGPLPPVQATITAWGSSSITVTVPSGAQAGPVIIANSDGMTSNVSPNTMFFVLGNVYVKLFLGSTSTPITSSANMRIFIGGPNGMASYYDGDGSTVFNTSTYVYTIPNVPSMGFAWAYDASATDLPAPGSQFQNTSSTNPLNLILAGASVGKVTGIINAGSTYGANKMVAVMALPQGSSNVMGPGGVQPQFFTTNSNGTTSYAIAIPANGTYDIEAHMTPSTSSTPLSDPSGQNATISTSTVSLNFTFTTATRKILGQVVGANGSPLADPSAYNGMFVNVYQPVAGGNSSVGQPDSSGNFTLYANDGVYNLDVSGPNVPNPIGQSITVTDDPSFDLTATSSVVIIKLQPPTSYISGTVKDGQGNAISGADINAFCVNGPGNGHTITDNQGSYKMYVPACSNYDVNGFSPNYGKLADQTSINVPNNGNATVNFFLSSSNYITVSGIIQENSSALAGANVWITEGELGMGIAGGNTDASGNFSLTFQKGLSSDLYLHASVNGMGQVVDQSLGSVTTSTSEGTINATVATITVHLELGNTFNNVFLGAHSAIGGGYSNTPVATSSSYDTYDITVPYSGSSTNYTISGGIPGGSIPATTTAVGSGGVTVTINLSSGFFTVSGTVSGNASSSYVWAGGPNGGGGTAVNPDGSFSLSLPSGTYDIGVNKTGFIGSMVSGISAATSGLALSLTTSTQTISGTVEYNGASMANVNVWADNGNGGYSSGYSDANGNFSLSVGSGSYTLNAITNGYNGVAQIVSSGASGVILNLTAISFTPTQTTQSVSPSNPLPISSSNSVLSLPQGMVSGSTNVQISMTNTMNTPNTTGASVVGTGVDISASYVSGSTDPIHNLLKPATIEMVLTKSDLTAKGISNLADAENIYIGYLNNNSWVQIPTTFTLTPAGATWDTLTSIKYSGSTTHFSIYAPISQSGTMATPTGVTASAGNAQVTISWNAVSGAAYYEIFRQSVGIATTTAVSYADTGLSNGTAYSYAVEAFDSAGSNHSAASGAVSATPAAPASSGGGGGGGGISYAAPSAPAGGFSILINNGASMTSNPVVTLTLNGGSDAVKMAISEDPNFIGASQITYASSTIYTLSAGNGQKTVYAKFFNAPGLSSPTVSSTITLSSSGGLGNSVIQGVVSSQGAAIKGAIESFTHRLVIGMSGAEVKSLQELLAQDKSIYPQGIISGYFGALTQKAVERFQEKYGIAHPGIAGYGEVGPHTMAKLNELLSSESAPAQTSTSTSTQASSATQTPSAANTQLIEQLQTKIQELQQQLVVLLNELAQSLKSGK
ncbi:MAG: carboxypeptidase regulatory-like domain-containing protein [Patescibacteria group bacterium]|nr:carboxypeptidase regulatory-like domain-containing protein [Patescibacteria group bacterium]